MLVHEILYEASSTEEWRQIPGWSRYEVSTQGRVRNPRGQIIKPQIHYGKSPNIPYYRVKLVRDGIRKNLRVGRLVALTFIPNPQNLPEVDHISGDSLDNSVGNLEWVSSRENIRRKRARELERRKEEQKDLSIL